MGKETERVEAIVLQTAPKVHAVRPHVHVVLAAQVSLPEGPVLQALRTKMQVESPVLRTEIQSLRADVYRQLWVMAAGIVGVTVTLIKLLP